MKNTNNKKILFSRLHPAVSNTMQEIKRVFLGSNPSAANDATYHNNAHFGCHGYGGEHTALLEDRLIAFSVLLLLLPVLIIRAFLAQMLTGSIIDKRKLTIHQDQILLLRFSGYFIGRKLLLMVNVMRGDIRLIGRTDYSSSRDTVPLKDDAEPFGVYSVAALRRLTGTDYTEEKDSKHTISGYRAKITFLLRYCIAILISPKNQLHRLPKIDLLGVSIDNYSISDALENILPPDKKFIHSQRSVHSNAALSYPSDKKKVFAFVNPDCLNKAVKDQEYRIALENMDGIFADGIGLQIAAKILGQQFKANVNGTDLFPLLCEHSKSRKLSIYLLGGRDGIAEATASWCRDNYPGLEIAGTQHGYFSMSETQAVIEQINRSGADILLVAFGAPHQEKWLNEHAATLSPLLQMGVGGLFDFYSGRVSRSPRWMQEIGLEWVWRLMQEPKRMWQRYIIGNPVFLYHVIKQRLTTGKKKLNPGISKVRRSSALQSSRLHFRQLSWRIFVGSTYAIKRVGDIFIAGCCTLLLSPLLLIVTVLIKLESPGPVFFSQIRVGRYGCFFKIYKFRSMYIDAEERKAQLSAENEIAGGVLFKMKSDPRVTRVGRFIRKYSIDELPQLLNVIRGDMSLVGPRPPLPGEVNEYKLADRRRLEIKPGITCIWQVSGRSDIPFDQQVQLDVDYIESQSIGQDIKILFKTIPAVLLGKGAY